MPPRLPSFSMIEAFDAAARHESFTRAAEELNLTQSAISHAIGRLEARVGLPLFQRNGRRVRLTAAGSGLAEQVRATLANLADALTDPSPLLWGKRLVIVAPPAFAARILLPCLSEAGLMGAFEVRTCTASETIADDEVDLLVVRGSPPKGLHFLSLGPDPLWAVRSPASMQGGRQSLSDMPLIQNALHPWSESPGQRGTADGSQIRLVVDDWSVAIDAAMAGVGACLAPRSLVLRDVSRGRLERIVSVEVASDESYIMAWNARRPPIGAAQALLERLRNAGSAASPRTGGNVVDLRNAP